MNNQKSQQTGLNKAKAKVEFRIHIINYIVVNAILAIINLTLTPSYIWFKWPLLGWGIGIILHALKVFYSGNTSTRSN
uniref:2TM domain-containing protein n=1 Tax=uncultured Draconibacterium sp. TaxID=1573823 RepID=UPI003217C026